MISLWRRRINEENESETGKALTTERFVSGNDVRSNAVSLGPALLLDRLNIEENRLPPRLPGDKSFPLLSSPLGGGPGELVS
jgi:hypothetical protein